MRKIVLIGLVLLALLVAMPASVSAGISDVVTVSGAVGAYIDVSVAAETLNFGSMTVGNNDQSTSITVVTNMPSWGVDVTGSDAGSMMNGATALTNKLQIGRDGANYQALSATALPDYMTQTTGTSATVNARQVVVGADPQGSYTITVTFTGGAN